MVGLFNVSLAIFLGIALLAVIKRLASPLGLWALFGAGSLLQGIMGIEGILLHGKAAVALWQLPSVPVLGSWGFHLDPLSDVMFAIMGVIGVASALVAMPYSHHKSPGSQRGMAAIVAIQYLFTSFLLTADNALPLLIGWETMSLCAYAYILVNHHLPHVRRAAYVTLFVSEVGFLMLVLAVILATPTAGNFDFSAIARHLQLSSPSLRDGVLLLALFGFGTKSGVFPTQLWMPDAYDVTPSHLSALLAGGLLNLGLFGILRFFTLGLSFSLWLGVLVVFIGATAVLFGALFAVIENKMRRLLAYSSVENVGLMVVNLGIAMVFMATHNPRFATVALIALFVQMVSHALAKGLAFLAVGEIARRLGTTKLSDLGGLFRIMPGVTLALLISALTLAAVAPFSGFASEWLTLQSMLQVYRNLPSVVQILIVVAGFMTATGAALGFTAFLRLFVFAMTGRIRNQALLKRLQAHTKEPLVAMGLGLLAVLSTFYGWVPTAVMPIYGKVVSALAPLHSPLRNVVPNVFRNPSANHTLISLGAGIFSFVPTRGFVVQPGDLVASIAPTYVVLWFLVFSLLAFFFTRIPRHRMYGRRSVPAWLGGRYKEAHTAQYTASAYANPYRMFWATALRYRLQKEVVEGTESIPVRFELERVISPWLTAHGFFTPLRSLNQRLSQFRRMQHGYLWGYLLVMLIALGLLLVWSLL